MKTIEKMRLIASLMMAAAIVFAGCKKDEAEEPALNTDKTAISATAAAGNYSIAVTSNTAWTVAVNSGATWCTVSPAAGEGNGAVAVNVAENPAIVERSATITIVAGTLTRTVAVTQDGASPTLTTDISSIDAAFTAGSYSVAVTSNTAWTVAVNSGATWCTVSPAAGEGNGAVAVNVAENPAIVERSATITIAAGALNKTVPIVQAEHPFYAAGTQTWTFGASTLVWSDAIHIPDCNKSDFTDSYTEPHCRSYTDGANTWYYYNWPYVNANKSTMCPSPWRVPTKEDFDLLADNASNSDLVAAWGYGGSADSTFVSEMSIFAYYWSATESDSAFADELNYYSGGLGTNIASKFYGDQVRCVK